MHHTLFRLALVVCGLAAGRTAQAQTSAPDTTGLVGTWRLVLYRDDPGGGTPEYPYGTAPVGLLVYDATGHMAVQIMGAPADTSDAGPDDDPQSAYTAYFGTYTVDWARHVVTHHVEANLYRVHVGTSNERTFALDGDRLTLTPVQEPGRPPMQGVRLFERVR